MLLISEEDESGEEEEDEDQDESSEEPVKMEVDKKDKQKKSAETTPKASVRIGFKSSFNIILLNLAPTERVRFFTV